MTGENNGAIWAVTAWIGVIFFSSTSLAGQWAEQFFHFLSGMFLNRMPPESSPYSVIHLLADKGFHVSLFFVLAILLWRALPNSPARAALILIAGAVVGSCSEFLQRFFPDRDPAIRDILINIAGTVVGLGVCIAAVRMQARQRTPVST
jgi:VanZ family protein